MASDGPFEPERAYWYTPDDRRAQLDRFAVACEQLAALYENRDVELSSTYDRLCRLAQELRGAAPAQRGLNRLAASLPERPAWLHPKFVEYQMPREQWQDEVATLRDGVERAAVELRSVATYEQS